MPSSARHTHRLDRLRRLVDDAHVKDHVLDLPAARPVAGGEDDLRAVSEGVVLTHALERH